MWKIIAGLLIWFGGIAPVAADIEEPAYQLIETIGPVELRRYEPSIQAQTVLGSSGETSSGFRRLAAFIFGENDESAKIAMTAPVMETLTEQQPVMAFTMPAAYSMQDLPRPQDQRIALREIPARTVAVIRFSGWATGYRVATNREELLATLAEHGIQPTGELSLNQYNPPWTLPFLRRNEIMVEIESDTLASAIH